MADTNRKINVEVDFATKEAQANVKALSGEMDGFSQSLANVSAEELQAAQKLERLERNTSRLQSRLANNQGFQQHLMSLRRSRAEAEKAAEAEARLAREVEIAGQRADIAEDRFLQMVGAQEQAGEASASLSSRAGAATASIGGMISVIGAGNEDLARLGGLASVAGSAISQLGTSMDPVSITISALTLGISALAVAMDSAAEAEARMREENDALLHSLQDIEQQIRGNLRAQSELERDMLGLGTEIQTRARRQRLEQIRDVTFRELVQARRERNEIEGSVLAGFREGRIRELDRIISAREDTLADLRRGIEGAGRAEAIARREEAEAIRADTEEAATAGRRRGRGGQSALQREIEQKQRELMELANERARAEKETATALLEQVESVDQIVAALLERRDITQDIAEEEKRMAAEADVRQRASEEQIMANRTAAARQRMQELTKEEEESTRRRDAEMARFTDAGEEAAGVLSNAFQLALTGQEDLGTALAAGFSDLMLQKGTQAVFDGTVALFQAAGYFATGNTPAGVGKTAEGLGLIALGASVGAVGAAIAPPVGGTAEQPRTEPDPAEAGGGTLVVNYNNPLAIVGDERTVAESLSGIERRGLGRQITPGRRAA